MATSNPLDYIAIQNVIARYCIALDTKDFDILKEVFTSDVETFYPFKGSIKGAQNVVDAIGNRLKPAVTQHALTTQTIEISGDGRRADATTYFTAIHFGTGKWKGKEVTAWGKYVDHLILVNGQPNVPGASGQWRIDKRKTTFMGRLGEEGVMEGESLGRVS